MYTGVTVEINGRNVLRERFQENHYVHRARLKEVWRDERAWGLGDSVDEEKGSSS